MKPLPKVCDPRSPLRITWFALLSVTLLAVAAPAAVGPGVASNFGLDGNLLSRSPSGAPYGTTDDWVPGVNAASTAVLDNAGIPIDALYPGEKPPELAHTPKATTHFGSAICS